MRRTGAVIWQLIEQAGNGFPLDTPRLPLETEYRPWPTILTPIAKR